MSIFTLFYYFLVVFTNLLLYSSFQQPQHNVKQPHWSLKMSIEQALAENTAALRDLIARLTISPNAITMSATEFLQDHNKPAAETAKVEEVKKPAASQPAKTEAVTSAAVTESPSETADLSYEKDIKPVLIKVSKDKGRDTLVALLAKFGVAKGDQLPAAKLNDVLTNANELLAA